MSTNDQYPGYHGVINWFPGHMRTAVRQLEGVLPKADVIVEVRDSRIPETSGLLSLTSKAAPDRAKRVVYFNKADLVPPKTLRAVLKRHRNDGDGEANHILSGSASDNRAMNALRRKVLELTSEARPGSFRVAGALVVIVGLPNVGKSSIINSLRQSARRLGRAGAQRSWKATAKVQSRPGVTRQVSSFPISRDPVVSVLDSPGLMLPKIESLDDGLKMVLTECIPDARVPVETLADYFVWLMLQRSNMVSTRRVWEQLAMPAPPTCTDDVLLHLCAQHHYKERGGAPDIEAAAAKLVQMYRRGELGRLMLD